MTEDSSNIPVLVFSDDTDTRQAVIGAIGTRPSIDLLPLKWTEVATAAAAKETIAAADFPVVILDAEAAKASGMVVARDLYAQYDQVPAIIMLTARPQDAWLATWAGASAIICEPLDAKELQNTLVDLLRASLHG